MKNRKEIDARELSHEDLIKAFDELSDDYITLEAEHLDFIKEVVEFTVLAGPFLKDSLQRKEIHGEGSIMKMQVALIEMNMALEVFR